MDGENLPHHAGTPKHGNHVLRRAVAMRRTSSENIYGEDWIRTAFLFAPLLYLDPGSGSLLIQAIVAAILSFLYFTRQFWTNIFSWFSRKIRREKDGSDDVSGSA
jgi:hypothetical protein